MRDFHLINWLRLNGTNWITIQPRPSFCAMESVKKNPRSFPMRRGPTFMSEQKEHYTITLDDDALIHKIIAQATGMPSLHYSCPDKLLKKATTLSPIAVFLDVNLQENVSGLDFVPSLREIWPMVPIIVMTGDRDSNLIGRSLASGGNDFLKKPINPSELMARMQIRICEMREKRGFDEILLADARFNPRLGTLSKGDR
ncbi:MAG: response regulator, partial [Proteobacteria bacterium]